MDLLSVLEYVIKKGRPHGHRYGKKHSETTEFEVMQLLKELINEVGMDFGNARIECPAKPISHTRILSLEKRWRKKQIRQVSEHVE